MKDDDENCKPGCSNETDQYLFVRRVRMKAAVDVGTISRVVVR